MKTIDLIMMILARYLLSVDGIHGIAHWGRVLENGRRLAPLTGADLRVIELFAMFHDSRRFSDGRDYDHGPRAAAFARGWRDHVDLDDACFFLLLEACDCHTRGSRRDEDVTVRTCLDADRLDIPRVGMSINPRLLFTEAARRETPRVCAEEWRWSWTSS